MVQDEEPSAGGIRRDQAPRARPGVGVGGRGGGGSWGEEEEEEEAATKKEGIASGAAMPEDGACRSFSKPGKPWFGS